MCISIHVYICYYICLYHIRAEWYYYICLCHIRAEWYDGSVTITHFTDSKWFKFYSAVMPFTLN